MPRGYTIRLLRDDAERLAFKEGYERNLAERSEGALRLSLPAEYLATSEAFGVFDTSSQLVGGYVLRREPPFRCLRAVPEEARRASPLLRRAPDGSLGELTCIWRNHGISTARFGTDVWPRIILDSVAMKRRYILGLGFENRMNDTYQAWAPEKIYSGPSAAPETQAAVHIFAFSRLGIAANFVTNFVLQMPRRTLRSMRGRR